MVHQSDNFDDSLPAYLTLKREYCEQFRQRAISKFRQDAYLTGLHSDLKGGQEHELSKDTIARILKGSRGRARNVIAICEYFEGDWTEACVEAVSILQETTLPSQQNIANLIQRVRSKVKFGFESSHSSTNRDQHGQWIQNNFIELNLIEVDFLPSEYPVSDPKTLLIDSDSREDEFDRMGIRLLRGQRTTSRKVLDDYFNIFVYGEPGSGKTSYLKWLALQCRDGLLLKGLVPIFIEIRHLATQIRTDTLLTFVENIFSRWGFSTGDTQKILASGSAVFIFDGLDETQSSDHETIEVMVEQLLRDYEKCRFIFSSRLTSSFDFFGGFQKVIIDDFQSNSQIPTFVNRWFNQSDKKPEMAQLMLEKLRSRKYQGIRELARRPVLLKLLCVVFEFEGDFPTKRVEVFSVGITRMTRATHYIETYISKAPRLQEHHIKSILRRVASYFFIDLKSQLLFSTRDVERIIEAYFADVYKIDRDQVPASTILNGIEKSSGLLIRWAQNFCAFSHLTYQEFFTAEHLVRHQRQTDVYEHLLDSRWYFVIGLVAELVPQETAWDFLSGMKETIDNYVNKDKALIHYLDVINQAAALSTNSTTVDYPHLQTYIRAWYFSYALEDTGKITNAGYRPKAFDLPELEFSTSIITSQILEGYELIYKAYHSLFQESYAGSFSKLVEKLKAFFNAHSTEIGAPPQVSDALDGWLDLLKLEQSKFKDTDTWWVTKKEAWLRRIVRLMQSLNLPCTFELSKEQKKKLRLYYTMTKLLSSCMHRSQLSLENQQELADSMLLLTTVPPDKLSPINQLMP